MAITGDSSFFPTGQYESLIVKYSLFQTGFFNTAFTQYVVEKPTVITSVTNTAAMAEAEGASKEKNSQHPTPGQTSTKCDIKETEL